MSLVKGLWMSRISYYKWQKHHLFKIYFLIINGRNITFFKFIFIKRQLQTLAFSNSMWRDFSISCNNDLATSKSFLSLTQLSELEGFNVGLSVSGCSNVRSIKSVLFSMLVLPHMMLDPVLNLMQTHSCTERQTPTGMACWLFQTEQSIARSLSRRI